MCMFPFSKITELLKARDTRSDSNNSTFMLPTKVIHHNHNHNHNHTHPNAHTNAHTKNVNTSYSISRFRHKSKATDAPNLTFDKMVIDSQLYSQSESEYKIDMHTCFHPFYARNNRAQTKKNLRCFPTCTDGGHQTKFYCGNNIHATIKFPPRFLEPMLRKVVVVGEIRPINEIHLNDKRPVWQEWLSLNDLVRADTICSDLQDANASRFKAKLKLPVRNGYEVTSIDAVFDPKPWGYQWTANRWHDTEHAFIISILIPSEYAADTHLLVAAQLQCSTFRIGCTRRLPCGHGQGLMPLVRQMGKVKGSKGLKAISHTSLHGYNHRDDQHNKFPPNQRQEMMEEGSDSDSNDEVVTTKTMKKKPTRSFDTIALLTDDQLQEERMFSTKELIGTDTGESAALLSSSSAAIRTFECDTFLTNETGASLNSDDANVLIAAAEQLSNAYYPIIVEKSKSSPFINLFESANLILSSPSTLSLRKPQDISSPRKFDLEFAEEASPHSPRTPRYVSV